MKVYIQEIKTGKIHTRTVKETESVRFCLESSYLVLRGYYDNKIRHKINVSKFGPVNCWIL